MAGAGGSVVPLGLSACTAGGAGVGPGAGDGGVGDGAGDGAGAGVNVPENVPTNVPVSLSPSAMMLLLSFVYEGTTALS